MTPYAADLRLALDLADAADRLTLSRFLALDLVIETKPDLTPVSDADRATEALLRSELASARPDDAVVGEEMSDTNGSGSGRRWILDPIDGTKNYVRGVPVWATLIALIDDGSTADDAVVGVVSAPALGRRWWAARGAGAWLGGALIAEPRRLRVSDVAALPDASLSYSDRVGWADGGAAFGALANDVWRTRAYGDFWSHLMVAEGSVDIACEPSLSIWDIAALIAIIEEAGGRVTGTAGQPVLSGGGAVTTNGRLHDAVLARLGVAQP